MAAGLGFKTFTTGEVLTAADTNGYLMQGINVFASSAARAAAITSPQEGQYSFLKDTNALEYYDGAAWVGAPVGDITAVTAGKGLTGGGSSGDVTVSLGTTAKGDLVAGSGASTAAVLTVGNNGETLVADSSTSTGLRYQNAVTVNYAINGGADIWQRGTSFSITAANPSYTADRWTQYFNGTGTVAQETTTIPTGSQYAIKLTSTSSNSGIAAYQLVEAANVYPLQGKTVTLSLQVAGTVTPNIGLAYSTTANDTLTSTSTLISATTIANPTVSTSLQTYAFSFVVPSTAKTLRIGVGTGSVVNGNYIIFGNVQLEIGSVYTRFQRSGGTIQGETSACQRYYEKSFPSATAPSNGNAVSFAGNASAYTTAAARSFWIGFKANKRTSTPTITYYRNSDIATNAQWAYYSSGWATPTTTATTSYNDNGFQVELAKTSGFTANSGIIISGEWTAEAEL